MGLGLYPTNRSVLIGDEPHPPPPHVDHFSSYYIRQRGYIIEKAHNHASLFMINSSTGNHAFAYELNEMKFQRLPCCTSTFSKICPHSQIRLHLNYSFFNEPSSLSNSLSNLYLFHSTSLSPNSIFASKPTDLYSTSISESIIQIHPSRNFVPIP